MATFRNCQRCGKRLAFAAGPTGKAIPLDLVAPVYRLDGDAAVRAEGHYVSHFATCPHAGEFSKGRKA